MTARFSRLTCVLLLPFLLASCVLTPGKFVSTLKIDAARHFTFTYVGEVIALQDDDMTKGLGDMATPNPTDPASTDEDGTPTLQQIALQKKDAPSDDSDAKQASADAKNRAMAAALSKEAGH